MVDCLPIFFGKWVKHFRWISGPSVHWGLRTAANKRSEGPGCSSWYTDGHGNRLGPSEKSSVLMREVLPWHQYLGGFWNEQIEFSHCESFLIFFGGYVLSQIFYPMITTSVGLLIQKPLKAN